MVVVRGINVFPAQVAAVLNRDDALSGEYRIVLDGAGPYDALAGGGRAGRNGCRGGDDGWPTRLPRRSSANWG